MSHPHHQFARDFFAAFFGGRLTEDFLAPDMKVWTTLGPLADHSTYVSTVNKIMSLFAGGSFNYIIDGITAEDDRVVVEAHGKGTFPDGVAYENAYVFVLRLRDGRVAAIAEHFNPIPAMEKLFPRMNLTIPSASK